MYKAILHIDDYNDWKKTLAKANNLIVAIENEKKDYEIIILANSKTVTYYDNENIKDELYYKLKEKSVSFVACNNALSSFYKDYSLIDKDVVIVPAGILELVKRQNEGFAYVRI